MKLDTLPDFVLISMLSLINDDSLLEYRLLNNRMNNLILNSFLHVTVKKVNNMIEDQLKKENFYNQNSLKVKHLTYYLTRGNIDLIKYFKNVKSLILIGADYDLFKLKELKELNFQYLNTINLKLNDTNNFEPFTNYFIPNILQHVQNFKIEAQDRMCDFINPLLTCLNPSKIQELRIISELSLEIANYEGYICSFINLEILEIRSQNELIFSTDLNTPIENKNNNIKEILLSGSILDEESVDISAITKSFIRNMIYKPTLKKLILEFEEIDIGIFIDLFFKDFESKIIYNNDFIKSFGINGRGDILDFNFSMFTILDEVYISYDELNYSLNLVSKLNNINSLVLYNIDLIFTDWEDLVENNSIKKLTFINNNLSIEMFFYILMLFKSLEIVNFKDGTLKLNDDEFNTQIGFSKRNRLKVGIPSTEFINKPLLINVDYSFCEGNKSILDKLEENEFINICKV